MLKKLIILIIIILIILAIISVGKQIQFALGATQRLDRTADNLFKLQEENIKLKKELVKVQSINFIEEQARNKLNFAKPGETIVVIKEEDIEKVLGAKIIEEIKLPNWQAWLKLIFN